jgi:hypothetical protein
LLRKVRAVTLASTWKKIVRSMAALLLMVTMAAPALAEIGCIGGCLVEFQAVDPVSEMGDRESAVGSDMAEDERDSRPAGHCPFGSVHCAGIAPHALRTEPQSVIRAEYGLLISHPTVTRVSDTPERPPAS